MSGPVSDGAHAVRRCSNSSRCPEPSIHTGLTHGDRRLVAAARDGDVKKIRRLLQKHKVNVNARDPSTGNTALMVAALIQDPDAMSALLEYGADPTLHNYTGQNCLDSLPSSLVQYVLRSPDAVTKDSTLKNDSKQLLLAAWSGNKEEVQRLLAQGGLDVACTNVEGSTPLTLLCRDLGTFQELSNNGVIRSYEPLEVIHFLLEHGVDVNHQDRQGRTSLHYSSHTCCDFTGRVVSVLLQHGAKVDIKDKHGFSALHFASQAGSVEAVQLLLDAGADPSIGGLGGITPLHLAASAGNMETVLLLLKRGADVLTFAQDGKSPLCCATSSDVYSVLRRAVEMALCDKAERLKLTPLEYEKKKLGQLILHTKHSQVSAEQSSSGSSPEEGNSSSSDKEPSEPEAEAVLSNKAPKPRIPSSFQRQGSHESAFTRYQGHSAELSGASMFVTGSSRERNIVGWRQKSPHGGSHFVPTVRSIRTMESKSMSQSNSSDEDSSINSRLLVQVQKIVQNNWSYPDPPAADSSLSSMNSYHQQKTMPLNSSLEQSSPDVQSVELKNKINLTDVPEKDSKLKMNSQFLEEPKILDSNQDLVKSNAVSLVSSSRFAQKQLLSSGAKQRNCQLPNDLGQVETDENYVNTSSDQKFKGSSELMWVFGGNENSLHGAHPKEAFTRVRNAAAFVKDSCDSDSADESKQVQSKKRPMARRKKPPHLPYAKSVQLNRFKVKSSQVDQKNQDPKGQQPLPDIASVVPKENKRNSSKQDEVASASNASGDFYQKPSLETTRDSSSSANKQPPPTTTVSGINVQPNLKFSLLHKNAQGKDAQGQVRFNGSRMLMGKGLSKFLPPWVTREDEVSAHLSSASWVYLPSLSPDECGEVPGQMDETSLPHSENRNSLSLSRKESFGHSSNNLENQFSTLQKESHGERSTLSSRVSRRVPTRVEAQTLLTSASSKRSNLNSLLKPSEGSAFHTVSSKTQEKNFHHSDPRAVPLPKNLHDIPAFPSGPPFPWVKGKLIGKGAFGLVWCGLRKTGELVAVKQFQLDPGQPDVLSAVQLEVDILQSLKHTNIVSFLGVQQDSTTVNLFLEFVSGGTISSNLAQFGGFPESVVQRYTKQLLNAVSYLHSRNVIHRDIKGNNVMVCPGTGTIKLIDFGCATFEPSADCDGVVASARGTPYWMAPEVICQEECSHKSDIWSIGCTVIEMFQTKPPWYELSPLAAAFAIGQGTSEPKLPEQLSSIAEDFIHSCLKRTPGDRPTAEELLTHQFLQTGIESLSDAAQLSSNFL